MRKSIPTHGYLSIIFESQCHAADVVLQLLLVVEPACKEVHATVYRAPIVETCEYRQ